MAGKPGNKNGKPWAPAALSALVTCAFLALVAVAHVFGGDIMGLEVQASSAFSQTARLAAGFAIIGIPALAAWGISINHRCINVTVRRILLAIDVVMGVWLCAACVISAVLQLEDPPLVTIAVVSDLVIMLFIESYIDARILPSIHRYRTLFSHLPLDLRILNEGGRVIYKTDTARPLDVTTLWRLVESAASAPLDDVRTVQVPSLPTTVFKLYRLEAGTALLTEDASERIALQRRLEERQEQLTAQNEILRRNHAMQTLLYRQQRERELEERVERDLAATAEQIRDILDNIVSEGPHVHDERLRQLNLVKVLVAYSKRKGMLALAAAESDVLSHEQFELIAREARADLRSIGIECAILVESAEPISITAFNTVYDCFYDCILSVLPRTNPVVMTYITTRNSNMMYDEDAVEMRAVIECGMGLSEADDNPAIPQIATSTETWTAMQMEIARDLEDRLSKRDGAFEVTLDEGLVNARVRVASPPSDGQPSRIPQAGER